MQFRKPQAGSYDFTSDELLVGFYFTRSTSRTQRDKVRLVIDGKFCKFIYEKLAVEEHMLIQVHHEMEYKLHTME